jgi:hypothetical protein
MVFMGAAGAMMIAGAAGAAIAPTPLPISGGDAVQRIAAVLWRQQPDGAAVAAAADLETKQDLEPIARQMLADPRATEGVGAFFRWWLELDSVRTLEKDPSLFPDFTPLMAADMANETATFGTYVTRDIKGSFETLMTAPFSLINTRLAVIYGLGGIGGDSLRRVDLPAGQRAGLLTQPALQALGSLETRNSPSRRGLNVAEKFFCTVIPREPPGTPGLPPLAPDQTVRQELELATQSAVCKASHAAIDPLGYVFEGFDAIGRARATDNGVAVDATSTISLPARADTPWAIFTPADLAFHMAGDPGVQACYAQQWLSFALGRDLTVADQTSLQPIEADFQASGFDLQELIVSVLLSDTFLTAPP